MYFYTKAKSDISHGAPCFHSAVKAADKELASDEILMPNNQPCEINASNIQTILIQMTGRYCDRYASDLIATLSDLQPFLYSAMNSESTEKWVIPIGIRENGVDHESFILSRLSQTRSFGTYINTNAYRKILALEITEERLPDDASSTKRIIKLFDITHSLLSITDKDLAFINKKG